MKAFSTCQISIVAFTVWLNVVSHAASFETTPKNQLVPFSVHGFPDSLRLRPLTPTPSPREYAGRGEIGSEDSTLPGEIGSEDSTLPGENGSEDSTFPLPSPRLRGEGPGVRGRETLLLETAPVQTSNSPPPDESPVRDPESIQSAVDEVMSAPEYRHLVRPKVEEGETKLPSWLERFLDWLFGANTGAPAPNLSWLGILLHGFMYLVAVAILVLVAILIVRSVLRNLPDRSVKKPALSLEHDSLAPATPPGELPADEYVRRALELSRAGDHKAAIRQLLLGTMSWIERAGLIRFRKGLTNRDYLRAVWRRETSRNSMAAITDAFDLVYFGRRVATGEVFERCLQQYQTGFSGNEAISMAS